MRVTTDGPSRSPRRRSTRRGDVERGPSSHRARQGLPWSRADRERDRYGVELRLSPTRDGSANRPTMAEPARHARQSGDSLSDDARIEANKIKGQAAAGADPAAEKKVKAETARRQRGNTLARLVDTYAAALPKSAEDAWRWVPVTDYVVEELAQIRLALATIGAANAPCAELTEADVRDLLHAAAQWPASASAPSHGSWIGARTPATSKPIPAR